MGEALKKALKAHRPDLEKEMAPTLYASSEPALTNPKDEDTVDSSVKRVTKLDSPPVHPWKPKGRKS